MHPVKMIAVGMLAWPVAEITVFMLVAALLGAWTAFVLLILVSFAGLLVLRQVGGGVVSQWRATAGATAGAGATLDGSGMASGIGGILLLIPGFITGMLGAMMVFPASRGWLLVGCRRLYSGGRRAAAPEIVDLKPDEWQSLPHPKFPPSRRRQCH